MEVKILEEAGHNVALYGFSLSYKDRAIKPDDWWDFHGTVERIEDFRSMCTDREMGPYYRDNHPLKECEDRLIKVSKTATANAPRGKGHNKFLRQIMLWVDIEAPRYFWSEFDTYKVGTVAQSESTMHTLMKRDMVESDLESESYDYKYQKPFVTFFNKIKDSGAAISNLKGYVPESYLQRRVVTMNYEVLRQIIKQRKGHRLPEWAAFIAAVMEQVVHPEYLEDLI